mgnify:CR=1 FL=1
MKSKTINELVNAVMHYQRTGKHKQVKLRYDPETRTEFSFSSWKHERDHDSVRAILPEDIIMSGEGHFYVVGKDNRPSIPFSELFTTDPFLKLVILLFCSFKKCY